MQAHASIKEIRISSRKMNLVASLVRRKSIQEAIAILRFSQKSASIPLIKLINSCVSNAVNNQQMNGDELYVMELLIGEGRTGKRIRPRARGRSARIYKRTSRVSVILCEKMDMNKLQKRRK